MNGTPSFEDILTVPPGRLGLVHRFKMLFPDVDLYESATLSPIIEMRDQGFGQHDHADVEECDDSCGWEDFGSEVFAWTPAAGVVPT